MYDNIDKRSFLPEEYTEIAESDYRTRTLNTYRLMVFQDDPGGLFPKQWLSEKPDDFDNEWTRRFHAIAYYQPIKGATVVNPAITVEWEWPESKIFGGYDVFFQDKSIILDLGSGYGQVTKEINDKYNSKGIKCYGVDYRYKEEKPPNGSQLVAGHFSTLPFRNDSFDRILSVESFPAHLPKDKASVDKYIREITRVSKEGTIWRGSGTRNIPRNTQKIPELYDTICRNGWELVVTEGDFFIARLKESQQSNKSYGNTKRAA